MSLPPGRDSGSSQDYVKHLRLPAVIDRIVNMKAVFAALLGLGLSLQAPALPRSGFCGQAIDPFYLKSLKEGESQFQAKHYKEASDCLEIAAFGLHSKKDDLARTHVFLALCYAYLNDSAKSEQNVKSALALLGTDGLAAFDLPEPAKTDLAKVIRLFGLDKPAAPKADKPVGSTKPALPETRKAADIPAVKSPESQAASAPATKLASEAALRERIRLEPRLAEPYYALAGLQVEAKDPAAARATLNSLLENNPAEIRAHLEIGRIAYRERRLKDAEKELEKFLDLNNSVPMDRRQVLEGKVLLALSAYLRGDSKKALDALNAAPELADPAFRAGLGLPADDLERLARLLKPPAA
jgi:tetratricopeptide (TPR) repeat protein